MTISSLTKVLPVFFLSLVSICSLLAVSPTINARTLDVSDIYISEYNSNTGNSSCEIGDVLLSVADANLILNDLLDMTISGEVLNLDYGSGFLNYVTHVSSVAEAKIIPNYPPAQHRSICSTYKNVKAINYSPMHNPEWRTWEKDNDATNMEQHVFKDLAQIKEFGFNVIKTYNSSYCPNDGQNCVDIAKIANELNMKVYLGVYEFQDSDWTATQIDTAVNAALNYPYTVAGIIVGNEDLFFWDTQLEPDLAMQERVALDMENIRTRINPLNIPVFTAQQNYAWMELLSSDPYNIIGKADIIGTNIYPFWGGSYEKINGISAASTVPNTVSNLSNYIEKEIMVTEEGWPSAGGNPSFRDMDIYSANDYFSYWKDTRNDDFRSFYFQFFDKNTSNDADADESFGICTDTGNTKPESSIYCDVYIRPR